MTSSMEYEEFRASVGRDVDGAAAAVDAGDLVAAEARLEEALKTVRESMEQAAAWQEDTDQSAAWHDGTGSNLHDGTGSNLHGGEIDS